MSTPRVLASKQPGDRLVFTRKAEPDDIAAYLHSGGTTGSPKLVRLTHRGFSYKFWANTLVMAHTSEMGASLPERVELQFALEGKETDGFSVMKLQTTRTTISLLHRPDGPANRPSRNS